MKEKFKLKDKRVVVISNLIILAILFPLVTIAWSQETRIREKVVSEEKREALEKGEMIPWKPGDPLTPERKEWLRSRVELIKSNMYKNDSSIEQALSELHLFQVTDMAADAKDIPIKYRSVRKSEEKITSIAPDVVEVLVEVVKKHKVPLTRASAVGNLKLIGEQSVIPELITALENEEDMLVKVEIAKLLVDLGEKEAPFPILADFVRRKDIEKWKVELPVGVANTPRKIIEVRIPYTLEYLAKIGTKESISIIKKALNDRNPEVREKAAHILGVDKE